MNRLPLRTTPEVDESLLGYVARAADRNGHPALQHVLSLGGLSLCRAELLQRRGGLNADELATFFGCTSRDFQTRILRPVRVDGTGSSFLNFFGSPVRALCCEQKLRRVAPGSLKNSAYHRATWILRPLTFCPENGELLIDTCPNESCRKKLGWRTAFGIQFCEHCVNDDAEPTTNLCDYPQPRVPDGEIETLRFLAGLIDPDLDAQAKSRMRVPSALQNYANWQLFDLAQILAFMHLRRNGTPNGLRLSTAHADPDWTSSFAAAGDSILSWPNGISSFIEAMRLASPNRSGYFGLTKELGPLTGWGSSEGLQPALQLEIEKTVLGHYRSAGRADTRSSYDVREANVFIRYTDAVRKYGLKSKNLSSLVSSKLISIIRTEGAKRAPVYINEGELAAALKASRGLVALNALRTKTGVPPVVLAGLAAEGYVKLETGPGAKLRGRGPWIAQRELSDFVTRVEAKAQLPDATFAPIRLSMRAAGISSFHTAGILRDCLDGKLAFALGGDTTTLFRRFAVRPDDLLQWGLGSSAIEAARLSEAMTAADVSLFLDIRRQMVGKLLDAGLLTPVAFGTLRKVCGESVRRFAELYVSSATAARRMQISRARVADLFAAKGIHPCQEALDYGIILWPRRAVDGV